MPPAHDQPFDESVERLLALIRKLSVPIELDELLQEIIAAGCEMLRADRGTIFLYDSDTRELYSLVASGIEAIRISIETGIAGEAARTRSIINVPDCYADPRFNREVDRATGYHTRNLITVPLIGIDDALVGVLQLLNAEKGHFGARDERLVAALASQAAVALQRAQLQEDRMIRLKLEADLDLAREIQQAVIPRTAPSCDSYDIAVFNFPPEETGGDIFDIVRRPEYDTSDAAAPIVFMLADATGHGIGPALSVVQARAMFRMAIRAGVDLDNMLIHLNRQVGEDASPGRFITAFIGRLDPSKHAIEYHAAGQGPIGHYHAATGEMEYLNATTVPLGVLPDLVFRDHPPITLDVGDVFVLLTDGFYERTNPRREQFEPKGVAQVIKAHHDDTAQAIVQALVDAQNRFADGMELDDDLTAIVIKRTS